MSNPQLENAFKDLQGRIGEEFAPTEWYEVTQETINKFADAIMDHQWIHVDEERSKNGPFGKTIAHGQLTLSMMNHLPQSDASKPPPMQGQKMGINYGFNKVRFPLPVPVGSQVRSKRTLKSVEIKGDMIEAMYEMVMEVKGENKPACVAESLTRLVF